MATITIHAVTHDDIDPEHLTDALEARLDEVYTHDGPVSLRVVLVDIHHDDQLAELLAEQAESA